MNALVVFHSKFGNTERVAHAIAEGLEPRFSARVANVDQIAEIDSQDVSLILVGGPTQMADISPALQAVLSKTPKGALSGVSVAAFDTRYRMPLEESGSAAHKIAPVLSELGGELLVPPESFFVLGGEGPLDEGEIERATNWGAKVAAKV
ncbi:MAG: nitric oxide synthase [Anaerolineales bacterium]|nr:nitric oxide synthase [Anaerolineales bacterium]